jgi:hypothetical protein
VPANCTICRRSLSYSRSAAEPRRPWQCLCRHSRVAVPIHGTLGDGSRVDTMVIAAPEQRSAGRRANRGCVERVLANPPFRDAAECGSIHLAADHIGQSETNIIQKHKENIRRVGGKLVRLFAMFVCRRRQGITRLAGRGNGRERQNGARRILPDSLSPFGFRRFRSRTCHSRSCRGFGSQLRIPLSSRLRCMGRLDGSHFCDGWA